MLYESLGKDDKSRKRCNTYVLLGLQVVVKEFPDMLEWSIRSVLSTWSMEKFTEFIEKKVAHHLNWIRINGCIVGALLGFGVWIFLEWVYMPLWQVFFMGR